ncbi:MAG: alanine racemase [Planctomycetota bacterium]
MESYLTAEISASAVRENLSLLRRQVSPATKLCAVVKADAYGHGLKALLPVISSGADALAVATPQEAIALREAGYERPLLMFFSPCACADGTELREALRELIIRSVTLTVVNVSEVAAVAEAAGQARSAAQVHVMIDTGMNRSGVPAADAPALLGAVRRTSGVELTGLYTHFASADEADKTFAREQLGAFLSAVDASGGRSGLTLHAANSAAAIDLPDTHLDMVRPGIAVYGYQPSDEMHTKLPLRPCLRLWGRLMQIKDVPAGARCGYGLTHTFKSPSRLGLVPVGYADGYPRSLSNISVMRIGERELPVRGRVSMDQTIIDLTDAPEAGIGDAVEIISDRCDAPNSVANLARLAETIPYELTCRLGRRVCRVLVDWCATFFGGAT